MNRSITFCILCLVVSLSGCGSAGGSRSVRVESPDETYEETLQYDSRGQPTQTVTHKIHPQTGAAYGSYSGVVGYGGIGMGTGSAHTDVPSDDTIRCVRMTSGPHAGQIFCPRQQGVVPFVRSSVEPGEAAEDPYKRQTVNNAAAIEAIIDCLKSGQTDCR